MMKKKRFFDEDLKLITVYSHISEIGLDELAKFLKTFSARVDSELIDKIPDNRLDEKRLKVFTGLTWPQLYKIRDMITTTRNSIGRKIEQALVVFMLKLRSGNSNSMVASILGIY